MDWTAEQVVPYREEQAGGGRSCPTDEALLTEWIESKCGYCATWWVERVWREQRYQRRIGAVRRLFPEADYEEMRHVAVCQTLIAIDAKGSVNNAEALFHTLLKRSVISRLGIGRQTRELTGAEEEDTLDQAEAPAQEEADPRLAVLSSCLEHLPEKDRDVLHAVYTQGSGLRRIAQASGRAATAVAKQLSRARAKLRQCIERNT